MTKTSCRAPPAKGEMFNGTRSNTRDHRRGDRSGHDMKTAPVSGFIDTVPSQVPALYMAIGNAITAWQFVETALCAVFCKVSACRDDKVASAIFYTPLSFRQKLDICRSAARLSLAGSPLMDEFNSLRARMVTASKLRNALAHFHVGLHLAVGDSVRLQVHLVSSEGELTSNPQPSTPPSRARIMLNPNASDPNEQFRASREFTKKPMGIKDVVELSRRFVTLQVDLKTFSEKITAAATEAALTGSPSPEDANRAPRSSDVAE
jgi:hypothetical protein